MVETREVLERILARLPPRALRDSCNGVLLSELDTVRSCLDNVSEAFKKLKEVGEAVTMLQLDKSDRRRSDRLMALVDSTEETQRDTMLALRRMRSVFAESQAVGGLLQVVDDTPADTGANDSTKRRSLMLKKDPSPRMPWTDVSATETKHSPPESSDKRAAKSSNKRASSASHSEDSSSDSAVYGSALLERAQTGMKVLSDELSDSKFPLTGVRVLKKLIADIGREGDDGIETGAAMQVTGAALDELTKCLARIRVAPDETVLLADLVKAITKACKARPMFRSHVFRAQAQIESYLLRIKTDLSCDGDVEKVQATGTRVATPSSDSAKSKKKSKLIEESASVQSAVKHVLSFNRPLLPDENECVEEIIQALEESFKMKSEASIRSYVSPFGDITRKVVKLILTRPIDPKMVGKLERFCKNVEAFSRRMPASNHQVGMSRATKKLVDKLEAMKKKKASLSVRQQQDSPVETKVSGVKRVRDDSSTELDTLHRRVANALRKVTVWQDGIFSLKLIDSMIRTITDALNYSGDDWKPRDDRNVRECVAMLNNCVAMIKDTRNRKKRQQLIDRWGMGSNVINNNNNSAKSRKKKY